LFFGFGFEIIICLRAFVFQLDIVVACPYVFVGVTCRLCRHPDVTLESGLVRHTVKQLYLHNLAEGNASIKTYCFIFLSNVFYLSKLGKKDGGLTLWRKLNRAAAVRWNIFHWSKAPFKFEM
jgi:hypothetical protein